MPKDKAKAGTSLDRWDSILGTVGSISEPKVLVRIINAAAKRLAALSGDPRSGTSPRSRPASGKEKGASKGKRSSKGGKKTKTSVVATKVAAKAKSAKVEAATSARPKRSTQKKKIQRLKKKLNGTFKFKDKGTMPALTGEERADAERRLAALQEDMAQRDAESKADQSEMEPKEKSDGSSPAGRPAASTGTGSKPESSRGSEPSKEGTGPAGGNAGATSGSTSDTPTLMPSRSGPSPGEDTGASGVSDVPANPLPTTVPGTATPLSLDQRTQQRDADRAAAGSAALGATSGDTNVARNRRSAPAGEGKPQKGRLLGGASPRSRKENRRLRQRIDGSIRVVSDLYRWLIPTTDCERYSHRDEELEAYEYLEVCVSERSLHEFERLNKVARTLSDDLRVKLEKSARYLSEGARTRGFRDAGRILENLCKTAHSAREQVYDPRRDRITNGAIWTKGLDRYLLHHIGARDVVLAIGQTVLCQETLAQYMGGDIQLTELARILAYLEEICVVLTDLAPAMLAKRGQSRVHSKYLN